MVFHWPLRVYIEDTDAAGIVYYANYLRFLERARSEWLREQGFSQEALRQQDTLFVVSAINVKYKKPARLDDELTVSVDVEQVRKASMTLAQKIVCEGDIRVEAVVRIACTDTEGKPKAIPQTIYTAVNALGITAH